ncbi:13966_t:CDS:2, partial [Gigaspora margarita]
KKVTILRVILLYLKTIEPNPTKYDLPLCLAFGSFTALCKYLDINKNKPLYFTLECRGYNPLTSKYLISEITCAYDAGSSRHSGIAKAIETKVVISICDELYKGNNMIKILASDIEWNYSYSRNLNNKQEQMTGNKKRHNQDLLNFEDKYQNKRYDKTKRETINLDKNKKSNQLENHIEDAGNNKTNDVNSEQNESQDTSKKKYLQSSMQQQFPFSIPSVPNITEEP